MTSPDLRNNSVGPVTALIARWWLALLLVVVGAVAGGLVAHTKSTQYTAESRLVVGSEDLASYQVAGFALAAQELASNYSRYVDNSSVISANLSKALGNRAGALLGVSASPISGSDVISVEVVATSPKVATEGADSIAKTLVQLTTSAGASDATRYLKRYEALAAKSQVANDEVTSLSTSVSKAKGVNKNILQGRLDKARTAAATLNLQQSVAGSRYQSAVVSPPSDSQLNIVQTGSIVNDNSSKTRDIYVVAGAIVGLLLALVIASILERLRVRRSTRRLAAEEEYREARHERV